MTEFFLSLSWAIYAWCVHLLAKLTSIPRKLELGYLRHRGVLFGHGFSIGRHVVLALGRGAKLIIGEGVYIGDYSWITVQDGAILEIGSNTFIGHHTSISSNTHCVIGEYCAIAPYVTIIDANHRYQDVTKPLRFQSGDYAPVLIHDQAWIGTGAIILYGVTLGKHCVIGANAVVTNDIPDYSVAVGVPAKVIKRLT